MAGLESQLVDWKSGVKPTKGQSSRSPLISEVVVRKYVVRAVHDECTESLPAEWIFGFARLTPLAHESGFES